MRRALVVALFALSIFAVFLPAPASADVKFCGGLDCGTSVWTQNNCVTCDPAGYTLQISTDIQDSLGLNDITSVVAIPFSGNLPGPITLNFDGTTLGNIFTFDTFATGNSPILDPNNPRTGVYNIVVNTKASGSISLLTRNLDNPQQIPLLSDLAVSNLSTTPTVTFTQPAISIPPGYQIRDQIKIFDLNFNGVYRSPRTFFESGNASFAVPSGFLTVDTTYVFGGRVLQVDLADPGTAGLDNLENRSSTNMRVTILPAAPPVAGPLPVAAPNSFTQINIPGASQTFAVGINNSGQIVGARGNGDGFLLSGETFSKINVPGAIQTNPQAISDSGLIVGQYLDASSKARGFVAAAPYGAGNFTTIEVPFPGAKGTFVGDINAAGKIVGSFTDASGVGRGFLKVGEIFTTIDPPNAKASFASGINIFDQIVGSYRDATTGIVRGYLETGGTFSSIEVPGAFGTEAFKINNVGQIMGIYLDASAQVRGFLKSGDTFSTIDPISLPGATFDNTFGFSGRLIPTGAFGINDAGQIVGAFKDTSGNFSGYLSTPPTPPPIQNIVQPAGTCGGVPCNPWTAAFTPTFTTINGINVLDIGVKVSLNVDPTIDPLTLTALESAWQKGVQTIWGGSIEQPRVFVSDPSGKQYSLAFSLNFVDPTLADFKVNVKPGISKDTTLNWFTGGIDPITGLFVGPGGYPQPQNCADDPSGLCGYQGFLIAHEFGHMLGLFDEYVGGAVDPSNPGALCSGLPLGTAPVIGIMANLNQNTLPYTCVAYYAKTLSFLGKGFSLVVNGNAPPFPEPPTTDIVLGPDSEGPPDPTVPVPEAPSVTLMVAALVIAASCTCRRKAAASSTAA